MLKHYLAVTLALYAMAPGAVFAAGEQGFGTWKVRAQGTTNPPRSETRVYEDRGDGVIFSTRQGVDAQGHAFFSEYAGKYDGKEYPRLVKGSGDVTTITLIRVDPRTSTFTLKTDGKVTANGKRTVSADGKTMTIETTNVGGPTSVVVYDKQE